MSIIQTKNRESSMLWHMARATLILKRITRYYLLLQLWVAPETTSCDNNHSRSSAKDLYVGILISFALDPA